MILAGDIGGTKTVLGLYEAGTGPRRPVIQERFPSGQHPGLEAIVDEFLARADVRVTAAAFGVAGPVIGGRARITNLSWVVDAAALASRLGLAAEQVELVNDLVATATAIPHLEPSELHRLDQADATVGGPIGVVAPGTGLGEAYLVWNGTRYQAHASEGGHASFAPGDDVEIELLRFLRQQHQHVSYERVCSGTGIGNLFRFFAQRHPDQVATEVAGAVAATSDPTPVIVDAALHPTAPDPVSRRALEAFVSILGAETGNLALKLLATGGMYLGGGLPPRIVPLLDSARFRSAYSSKGRFTPVVAAIPVRVILEPAAPLIGAAAIACSAAEHGGRS